MIPLNSFDLSISVGPKSAWQTIGTTQWTRTGKQVTSTRRLASDPCDLRCIFVCVLRYIYIYIVYIYIHYICASMMFVP